MYVCICNAMKDKELDDAVNSGASSVSDVFKHHGSSPKCGSCVKHIRDKVGVASQSHVEPLEMPQLAIAAD